MSRITVPPSFSAPSSHITRVFGGHPFHTDGDLLALGFAADGTLWSIEEPGLIRRWDLDGRRQLGWHHLEELATLWAFSPGARHLASASDDLSIWEPATGELAASWGQPCWVTAVAFRPDADVIAVGYDDGFLRLWDWPNHKLLHEVRAHKTAISAVAFSADGGRLATAGEDKIIRLWETATARPLGKLVGHTDRIPGLVWHPSGERLYSAGWDTTARVWDVETLRPVMLLNTHAGQVQTLALSGDGGVLACADASNAIHLWDTKTHREIVGPAAQVREIRALAFNQDGRRLASGGVEHIIHVWDSGKTLDEPATGDPLASRAGVALSPDSRRLTALAAGVALGVWETESAQPAPGLEDAGLLRAFAASPDGKWIAGSQALESAESEQASLGLWDAATGQRSASLEGQSGPVTALAFSSDSALLAAGGLRSSDVWLWTISDGKPALIIPGAADDCSVEALAFHPSRPLLAVGGIDWMATSGVDGCVALWDVQHRRQQAVLRGGAAGLAFHPNGKQLAIASLVQSIRIWDMDEKGVTAEWTGHYDAVTCVAYSPEGRLLASGSDDHTVRLWDAETGAARAVVELDTQVKAVCFSADGRLLYTGNGNASCYELDVPRLLAAGL